MLVSEMQNIKWDSVIGSNGVTGSGGEAPERQQNRDLNHEKDPCEEDMEEECCGQEEGPRKSCESEMPLMRFTDGKRPAWLWHPKEGGQPHERLEKQAESSP